MRTTNGELMFLLTFNSVCAGGANVVHSCSQAPSKIRKAFLSAKVGGCVSSGCADSVEGTSPVLSYSAIAS